MSSRRSHPTPRRIRLLAPVLALVATAGLVTACASDKPSLSASPTTLPHQASSTSAVSTTTTTPLTDLPASAFNVLGYIATPKGAPQVFTEPDLDSAPIDVPATTTAGAPTTFAVIGDPLAQPAGWYKVMLPVRPNTATGWVQESTVDLTKTDLRLFIDLEGRTLTVDQAGAEVMRATIAIGTETNPTPTGPAFVTELIESTNPGGAYGPYAFGLSIHSDTLTEFAGGDGQVGVHGTNRPQLIGDRVSHGCVRLTNDDVRRLVDLQLPLGVPVFIT